MTSLTKAARNFLAQKLSVTTLLGDGSVDDADADWDTWIFMDSPEINIEGTGKAMIVLSVEGGWAGANIHNTARFPQLYVDVWVDPTRNLDGSVAIKDAKMRVEEILNAVDDFLHMVNNSTPDGKFVFWGTSSEIANRTGKLIISSVRNGEPTYRQAFDDQGAWMGTVRYNIEI